MDAVVTWMKSVFKPEILTQKRQKVSFDSSKLVCR